MNIRWTDGATANLSAIGDYIETAHTTGAASREVRKVLVAVERLGQFPNVGRPGRVPGTRELVVAPYVVAYRVERDVVQILRVLHGRQRWPERFEER